jgi:transcriptional regulator with XRE-family HTH domain
MQCQASLSSCFNIFLQDATRLRIFRELDTDEPMKPSIRKHTAVESNGAGHNISSFGGSGNGSGAFLPGKSSAAAKTPPKRPQSLAEAAAVEGANGANANGTGAVAAEAAEAFIESKRIGERIKFLRQRKQLGLVELGRHTGLSASFLSQLETGRVVPTLRNLARIAMVFSKDLSYFFEPERPELFRVVRAADRQRLPQTGAEEPGYFFESLGHVPFERQVIPYVAEFLPSDDRRPPHPHRHPGAEFLYVLSGGLHLNHDGHSETLFAGDAVYFNADAVHSYGRLGNEECTALILTMPEPLRGQHTGARIPALREPSRESRGDVKRLGEQTV